MLVIYTFQFTSISCFSNYLYDTWGQRSVLNAYSTGICQRALDDSVLINSVCLMLSNHKIFELEALENLWFQSLYFTDKETKTQGVKFFRLHIKLHIFSFQNKLFLLKVEGCIVSCLPEDWVSLTDTLIEVLKWNMLISVVLSNLTLVFKLLLRILRAFSRLSSTLSTPIRMPPPSGPLANEPLCVIASLSFLLYFQKNVKRHFCQGVLHSETSLEGSKTRRLRKVPGLEGEDCGFARWC